jgi:parallel beta-helix repeat protein
MKNLLFPPVAAVVLTLLPALNLSAGQGASRLLYAVPNTTFIEKTSGETIVNVNDSSGSISSVQTAINNARSASPSAVIVIRLLSGATYSVSSAGLVLSSHECLIASGATLQAASSSVTVPLIQVASGSTNVSVAGGILDGNGANINGIQVLASSRVNIDRVTVKNCGLDGILMNGNGNSTYDNEMTVTRCDVSGSAAHAGISIQNATQTVCTDNNCHDNLAGIYLTCAWGSIANNTCENNTTGIDIAGGNDNYVCNNTCNNNSTGIHAAGSNNMVVSDSVGASSTVGISSAGSGNIFVDNLFTAGNASNFSSGGSGNKIVAYKTGVSASGQNYFYPPLIDDQHSDTIVNGLGQTDLTITSTTIDSVQTQYNAARSANPNNVIVLHLNGTFTVGATALTLSSNTCVLLNGTIQINSSTGASAAIKGGTTPQHVSISGGIIDGGNLTGNNGIQISSATMLQVDNVTLRNFGPANPRSGGSDVIHFDHGAAPYIVTRCTINGSSSRGIWLQLSGVKSVMSDNDVSNVNQDGVDCDSSTSGCLVKFNYLHDLVRYGVFFEQSASHNLGIGNVCNNCGRDINVYNNDTSTRAATAFNSAVCNAVMGNNGVRNGSTGTNTTVTSHNFFFNNTVISASISSEQVGSQNYYSQNYQSGGSLSTSGAEAFFNSSDVDGYAPIQDSNSGLAAIVGTTNTGAAVVLGPADGANVSLWKLIPTDSGYFRVVNKASGLSLVVQGASSSPGAAIIQAAYTHDSTFNDEWLVTSAGNGLYRFVNRLSGLYLDVAGAGTAEGTAFDQQPPNGGPNQQFNLTGAAVIGQLPFAMAVAPSSQTVLTGGATSYTATITPFLGSNTVVTLSVTGLPANVVSSFTPPTVTGAGGSTLGITTASNTPPGIYTLTVGGAGAGITNTSTVTLVVNSGIVALPGTLLWTSLSGADINWSTAQNWTNVTSGGFGPPGPANDIVLTNFAVSASSNIVNNIMNSDVTIKSLTDNTTNGFHVTQIVPGGTLTIAGKLAVGTETDLGTNAVLYLGVSGIGSTLTVTNASANILVRQFTAGATGGSQRAILDLSALDTFNATASAMQAGTFNAGGTARSAGTIYLARTNSLLLLAPGKNVSTNAGIDIGDCPAANSSQSSFLYLGQQTAIYADGITVGGGRQIGWLGFSPGFSNPTLYLRGTNGTGRVGRWLVGDNSGASGTGSNSRGTSDFTGGTVDALVDVMTLGKGESPTMGSGSSTGIVMFAAGTIDVNTLQLGVQTSGASGGTGVGTTGTNYYGEIDVNGTATLVVNSNLLLTSTTGAAGAYSLFGILNLNGGTVQARSIANGGGTASVSATAGTLILSGPVGTPARPITAVSVTNSSVHVSLDATLIATNIASGTLNAGGVTVLSIDSLANVTGTNRFPLISYAAFNGSITNFAIGTLPSGLGGFLTNNTATQSIDLMVSRLPASQPTISSMVFSTVNQSLTLGGSNGTPGATYYILGSTNISLPLTNWDFIGADVFDGSGNFSFSIDLDPTTANHFYLLQVP